MKINLNTQENVKITLFPDGQPHVKVHYDPFDLMDVVVSLTDSNKLIQLLEVNDALEETNVFSKGELFIPYLMGARYDRVMEEGGSFDLRVIAKLINSMGWNRVNLLDVHSDVATALINNSKNVTNQFLVEKYDKKDAVLIIPDAGATKKAPKYFEWNKNIVESVQCVKHRNPSTGEITLKVLEPEKCKGRNVIIIDDICDGGRTFIKIAEQTVGRDHATLMCTHGIFSNGLAELEKWFDSIISTTSYSQGTSESKVLTRYKTPFE